MPLLLLSYGGPGERSRINACDNPLQGENHGTDLRRSEMSRFQCLGVGAVTLLVLSGPALAEGDAAKGKEAYAKCGICHQVGPTAQNAIGPELNKIVGRKAATAPGFTYSPGLKKLGDEGFTWTAENIDKWIADPKAMLPDSPMSQLFQGIPDAGERANIIAYLQTQ
jgi:cytochrome c